MDAYDFFDLLPDSVLLVILDKLADLKALGRCSLISKRFSQLAFKVDNVFVKFDSDISADSQQKRTRTKYFKRIVFKSLVQPFKALNVFRQKKTIRKISDHIITGEALKNFQHMRHLRVELPVAELVFGHEAFLKWRAEFGSTVEKCVILGASSLEKEKYHKLRPSKSRFRQLQSWMEHMPHDVPSDEAEDPVVHDENSDFRDEIYTEMEMRLSALWTVRSLAAATARHYLFRQIISNHPTLESLIITDATGQGTLSMSKHQLQIYRDDLSSVSASLVRREVPALNIKLWHAPHLQLSEGTALRGVTLVAMEPSRQATRQHRDDFITGAFEEPFNSATSRLTKRRTYSLEMQSI